MKTSSRARPISPSSCVEQLARLADERQARLVLVARPGASPTNIRSASALPAPKTTVCARRGQLRAARAAARLVEDVLERLAALVRRTARSRCVDGRTDRGMHGYPASTAVTTQYRDRHPRRGAGPTCATARPHPRACAVVGAGRLGTALAAGAARCRLRRRRPARPRRDARRAPTSSCSASPTPRSPPPRPRCPPPRPPRRPLLRRHDARRRSPPHEAFSLHPLMTVTARGRRLRRRRPRHRGHHAARAAPPRAASPRALGMRPVEVADADRAAYHAAALDRLELPRHARGRRRAPRRDRRRRPRRARPARARDASRTGPPHGAERALTGPIARGDEATVARQRAAVAERAPDLLDALRRAAPTPRRDARRADAGRA